MIKRFASLSLIAIVMLSALLISSYASTGVENITLSRYSGTSYPGGNLIVNYSINLVSGYKTFGTDLYIPNNTRLIKDNISVVLPNSYGGNPPIKGVMYIFLSHPVITGNYNIVLGANSSNVTVHFATFNLNVVQNASQVTSTDATTTSTASTSTLSTVTTSVTQTTMPTTTMLTTTILSTSGSGNSGYYLIVVILIILVVVVVLLRGKGSGKKKTQKQSVPQSKQPVKPEQDKDSVNS
jgi:hypothetical protein